MSVNWKWQRQKLFFLRRALQAHFFGVKGKKFPKKGDVLEWCGNGDGAFKRVAHVSGMWDNIEYEDGSSDSLYHCGWDHPPKISTTEKQKRRSSAKNQITP